MSEQNDRSDELDVTGAAAAEAGTEAGAEAAGVPAEGGEHHEHHHHHHHHHHHRHKTKAGRFFSKVKHFARRNRRALLAVLIVSLAVLVLLIATLFITYGAMTANRGEDETTVVDPSVGKDPQVLVRMQDTPYLLVQTPILSYVDRDSNAEPRRIQELYNMRTNRIDTGSAVTISYAVVNIDRYNQVASVTVTLSQNEDYSDAQVVRVTRRDITSVTFKHLETGRLYYFKVDAMLDNEVVLTTEHYFYTVTSPRILSLDGMVNVRDIGGWMYINDETAIKQGMLFRGSEFDGLSSTGTLATSDARDAMITKLNISSVLDLRGTEKHVDGLNTLGKNVKVKVTDTPCYDEIMYRNADQYDTQEEKDRTAAAKEQIRQIFAFLADESNYPIYMHDTYGVDETGTICAILEAYLGVSEQDIVKDYLMSTFSLSSVNKSRFTSMLNALKKRSSHGKLQEGAMLYLRDDCGVSAEELMQIRNILTEEARGVIVYDAAENEDSAETTP